MGHQAQSIIEANNRQASNGHSHRGRTVELQMAKALEDEQMSFKRPKPSRPTTEELQRATATEDVQRSFKRPKPSRPTTEELQTAAAMENEQKSFKRPKPSRPTTYRGASNGHSHGGRTKEIQTAKAIEANKTGASNSHIGGGGGGSGIHESSRD